MHKVKPNALRYLRKILKEASRQSYGVFLLSVCAKGLPIVSQAKPLKAEEFVTPGLGDGILRPREKLLGSVRPGASLSLRHQT